MNRASPPHLASRFRQSGPIRSGLKMPIVVAQHLGVNGVIDQRGDRLPVWALRLDHAHPPVVEVGGVIVVGDLALGLAGGDLEGGRLKPVDGLVHRLGGLDRASVHVAQVARVPSLAVGEGVAVRGAMGVGRADQDVRGRNPAHAGPHAIAQDRGEAQEVERDHRHGDLALAEDDGPGRQLAPLFLGRVRRPIPPETGKAGRA